jgi:hypothetical protein
MTIKAKLRRDISTALRLSAATLVVGMLPAAAAQAATIEWIGASADPSWTNPGNWLNGIAPQAGDAVLLTDANLSGAANVIVNYANPSHIGALNSLVVDGGMLMTLTQNSDTLGTVTLVVGDAGSGSYNMNGGTLNVTSNANNTQAFVVGNQAGAYGNFNQYGGTVHSSGNLTLGLSGLASGFYNIDGNQGNGAADLNVDGSINMGVAGMAVFSQNANSVVTVGADISMQNAANYYMNGGSLIVNGSQGLVLDSGSAFSQYGGKVKLSAADLVVGNLGNASYYQDNSLADATTSVAGNLSIGRYAGASGTYTLSDQGTGNQLSLSVAGSINVGAAGAGIFNQAGNISNSSPGGIVTTANNLVLGQLAGSQGTYNLQAGALLIQGGNLTVGQLGVGIFNQDNSEGDSTVVISQNSALPPNSPNSSWSTGNLYIGGSPTVTGAGNPGGGGTYNMTESLAGNTLSLLVTGEIFIGGNNQNGQLSCQGANPACNGAFIQSGGSVTVDHSANRNYAYATDIEIGVGGGIGSYILNYGVLTTPGAIEVGNAGNGSTFTQNGGTVSTGNILLATGAGSDGAYNLNGGVLNGGVAAGLGGLGVFNNAGGVQNGGNVVLGALGAAGNGNYNMTSVNSVLNAINISVGQEGIGQFNQYAGAVSAQTLSIGGGNGDSAVTGNGGYALSGGVLAVSGATTVGAVSQGKMSQTGGTFNAGLLILGGEGLDAAANSAFPGGYQFNSNGSYALTGGILNTAGITVSAFGLGAFTQDGLSVNNVSGDLLVGQNPSITDPSTGVKRSGAYTLNNGQLSVSGTSIIGGANSTWQGQPGGLGSFTQTGGGFQAANLLIGQGGAVAGGNGQYTMYGAPNNNPVLTTLSTTIGGGGVSGGVGSFNQYGGSHVTDKLTVGASNANGTYIISSGTLNVTGLNPVTQDDGQTIIGAGGTGLFIQTGASLFTTNFLSVASTAAVGGSGAYYLNAGALTVNNTLSIGTNGNGVFNQSGGTVNIGDTLYLGGAAGSSGLYALSGGSLLTHGFIETATGVLSENLGVGSSILTTTSATFGGEIKVGAGANFAPTVGQTYLLAQILGSYAHSGLSIDTSALALDTFRINYDAHDISLTVLTAATVPVPAGFWLFGSALLGALGLRRTAQAA